MSSQGVELNKGFSDYFLEEKSFIELKIRTFENHWTIF
jgi:hypothetical protein